MVSTSGPLLLAFRIRAHYEIKVLLIFFSNLPQSHGSIIHFLEKVSAI